MFRTESKVEKGRVAAHEGAESGVAKIHTLIDKVAEGAETGSDRAAGLGAAASAKSADLRAQAADASKDVRKDAKKTGKQLRKDASKSTKQLRKDAKKAGKRAGDGAHDLRDTIVDDVLPKVVATATGLAATGAATTKSVADEAGKRAPEAFHALKDDHDTHAALAAIKGETRRSGRSWKVLLLALVAGGVAFYVAKKQQKPKKDPWAVPAGDPYKAPDTGRASSVTPAAPVTDGAAATSQTPIADEVVADEVVSTDDVPVAGSAAPSLDAGDGPVLGEGDTTHAAMTGHPDGVDDQGAPSTSTSSSTGSGDTGLGETRPLSNEEIDELASDDPTQAHVGSPDETAQTNGEGGDAWSSARDWADEGQNPDDKRG